MRSLLILIRPRLLTIKNRWCRGGKGLAKELGMALMSLLLMAAIFVCTQSALEDTQKLLGNEVLRLEVPLTMTLSTLFLMMLLSASVSALGALFLSKDLDLVLSAPLTRWQMLLGKVAEVAISSAWMVIVFGLPTLLAFGVHFDAHWLYFVLSPVLGFMLLTVPCFLAVLLALLFATIISPSRGREVSLVLFVASLGVFITYLNAPGAAAMSDPSESSRLTLLRAASFSSNPWSPATTCAHAMRDLAVGHWHSALALVVLLTAICGVAAYASRIALEALYERAFTAAQGQRPVLRINSKASQRISRWMFPFARPDRRAIAIKEFKVFSRDITHTVQLGMLLTICFVYMYNFQVLRAPKTLSVDALRLWQAFLMLCNVGLSSLVVTSICSRFVFPSVSLEGTSFWILQSAPISPQDILKTKFRAWFIPLATISSVIFISGAMALNAEGPLVITTCIGGVILCYGLVGLGVGLGAVFSQFDWEYSAQLSTNLGSFLFLVASFVVLALDMVPLGLMFSVYIFLPPEPGSSLLDSSWLVIGLSLLALLLANRLLVSWALDVGARTLDPK